MKWNHAMLSIITVITKLWILLSTRTIHHSHEPGSKKSYFPLCVSVRKSPRAIIFFSGHSWICCWLSLELLFTYQVAFFHTQKGGACEMRLEILLHILLSDSNFLNSLLFIKFKTKMNFNIPPLIIIFPGFW